jgi:hypothetical protein
MPTVWEHLRAVFRHWVALMTGSVAVALYEILTIGQPDTPGAPHFWNHIPQWAVWEFALFCVVFAQFRAWIDMKRKRDELLITRPDPPLGFIISSWQRQREGEYHYLLLGLRPEGYYPEVQFRLHFDAPLLKFDTHLNLPDSPLAVPLAPPFPYQEDGSAKNLTVRTIETMRWERSHLLYSHEVEFLCELWSDQSITVTAIERIGY